MTLAVAPHPARAEALSRGRAVAIALRQNPRVAGARAVEMQAEARREQVRALRYPTVTATLGVGPSLQAHLVPGSGVESTENAYGDVGFDDLSVVILGQVDVTQPLYTFGKIDERQRATQYEIAARQAQGAMTRAEIFRQVATLYEGALLARELQGLFEETERWLARTTDDARLALGSDSDVNEQDVLRFEAGMAALRLGLSRARAGRQQAEAGLVAYLALPVGTTPSLSEPVLESLPAELPSLPRLIELALEHRPELRALSSGSAAYAALGEAEAAGSLPDFFVFARLAGGYTPGRDLVETRFAQDPLNGFYPALLLGARVQLTGSMAARRADEQRAHAAELSAEARWAKNGMPAEVVKAYADARQAKEDAGHADLGVVAAKQWAVRASADFSIGLGSSRDVADAASAYLELRIASIDARYRHNVALAELTRATGLLDVPKGGFYPTGER